MPKGDRGKPTGHRHSLDRPYGHFRQGARPNGNHFWYCRRIQFSKGVSVRPFQFTTEFRLLFIYFLTYLISQLEWTNYYQHPQAIKVFLSFQGVNRFAVGPMLAHASAAPSGQDSCHFLGSSVRLSQRKHFPIFVSVSGVHPS